MRENEEFFSTQQSHEKRFSQRLSRPMGLKKMCIIWEQSKNSLQWIAYFKSIVQSDLEAEWANGLARVRSEVKVCLLCKQTIDLIRSGPLWEPVKTKKPLIRQAGSAEAFIGSTTTTGGELPSE